jgi:hypothetical protein
MKKILIAGLGCLVLTLSLAGPAYAGNNYNIPVTLTIPAIPGVNVPLIQDEMVIQNTPAPASAKQEEPLIQQNSQGEKSPLVVRTLYDR